MSELLKVADLKVHFPVHRGLFRRRVGSVKAVDGVSFELAAGRTLGLVGESGCGKSTTARAILRLVDLTSGSITVDGTDVGRLTGRRLRRARRKMQMIFQDPYASLNPRMTVLDLVAEPLRIHRLLTSRNEAHSQVSALLERVGLSRAHLRSYPHELSGGQRQRVGIARALGLEPKLIIADEPVSALDMSIRAQIINLLVSLQAELGLGYLFIAHDLAVVRHISHEVAVMYLGRIVEHAPSPKLFAQPHHPYTQALLGAVPIPDPQRERQRRSIVLSGDVASPLDPPPGCAFHTRCPEAFDRCRQERPRLEERQPGHLVACHLDAARAPSPPEEPRDDG